MRSQGTQFARALIDSLSALGVQNHLIITSQNTQHLKAVYDGNAKCFPRDLHEQTTG